MVKRKYTLIALGTILIFTLISFFSYNSASAFSPYSIPNHIKNGWKNIRAVKDGNFRSGKNLAYDVYSSKFGYNYRIETRNFGKGNKQYLVFTGWAGILGRSHHTQNNHETYIVAVNASNHSNVKIYKTEHINISATEDVEYNNQGAGVWNECPANAVNKSNINDCNFRYDNVGFKAYLPLDELFPDNTIKSEWVLYIVKDVNGHVVYSPLIMPFNFTGLSYRYGTIDLSSGVNAGKLTMIGNEVFRRTGPGTNYSQTGLWQTGKTYTRVTQSETNTVVWYGVSSPHDNGATRYASSAYWLFSGDQAKLTFNPEKIPPEFKSVSVSNHNYKNGNDYWTRPNREITISLRQYDSGVGNRIQSFNLQGSGVNAVSQHSFVNSSTTHKYDQWTYPDSVTINSARRTENSGGYGTVEWKVTPKKHGHSYLIKIWMEDRAGNSRGYDSTGAYLKVDGVPPSLDRLTFNSYDYKNGNTYWIKPNGKLEVSIRQYDGHSGNNNQFLKLTGNGENVRAVHNFRNSSSTHMATVSVFPTSTENVAILSAQRTENTSYGTVKWTIQGKKHGFIYDLWYHMNDNVVNNYGYDTGVDSFGKLGIDGEAPIVQFRNLADTANFENSDWQERVDVRLKFSDPHSGYKRSRYAWTQSAATPTTWSSWSTSPNYVTSQTTAGEWYLFVQAEDNVGNVKTYLAGKYKVNRPPIADFDYSPTTVYEGDTLTLTNKSTDPDNHTLTAQWTVVEPDGITKVYTSWNLTIPKVKAGTYKITLKVTDIYGATGEITKNIYMNPLTISGKVEHTEEWKKIHEKRGHLPHQFYSGERFKLYSLVTKYPVEYVKVQFKGTKITNENVIISKDLTDYITNENYYLFYGDLYEGFMSDPRQRLKNGNAYFIFEAKWRNGVVKTDTVIVEIIDGAYKAFDLHRTN